MFRNDGVLNLPRSAGRKMRARPESTAIESSPVLRYSKSVKVLPGVVAMGAIAFLEVGKDISPRCSAAVKDAWPRCTASYFDP